MPVDGWTVEVLTSKGLFNTIVITAFCSKEVENLTANHLVLHLVVNINYLLSIGGREKSLVTSPHNLIFGFKAVDEQFKCPYGRFPHRSLIVTLPVSHRRVEYATITRASRQDITISCGNGLLLLKKRKIGSCLVSRQEKISPGVVTAQDAIYDHMLLA
ncbi:hypothetical protein J6590_000492 [Homalodisca vitripennis]|nr:hypothetical protein J6590_000492 [Homalodisca vitripennis]